MCNQQEGGHLSYIEVIAVAAHARQATLEAAGDNTFFMPLVKQRHLISCKCPVGVAHSQVAMLFTLQQGCCTFGRPSSYY